MALHRGQQLGSIGFLRLKTIVPTGSRRSAWSPADRRGCVIKYPSDGPARTSISMDLADVSPKSSRRYERRIMAARDFAPEK